MKNEMIITLELKLMEQGIIKGTGKFIEVENSDGEKKNLEIPEEIHTYQAWKAKGYQVQKGEKAIAKFAIWKHVNGKVDEETGKKRKDKMFLKVSAFFTIDQVKAIG